MTHTTDDILDDLRLDIIRAFEIVSGDIFCDCEETNKALNKALHQAEQSGIRKAIEAVEKKLGEAIKEDQSRAFWNGYVAALTELKDASFSLLSDPSNK